jgi:hypothetical protein
MVGATSLSFRLICERGLLSLVANLGSAQIEFVNKHNVQRIWRRGNMTLAELPQGKDTLWDTLQYK